MNEWVCYRDCEALGHFLSEELASERAHPTEAPIGAFSPASRAALPSVIKIHQCSGRPESHLLPAGGGGGDRLNKFHSRIYCARSSSASEQAHVSRRNTSLSVRGGGPSSWKAASRFLGEQG